MKITNKSIAFQSIIPEECHHTHTQGFDLEHIRNNYSSGRPATQLGDLATLVRQAASVQNVTYFVPPYTVANATFSLTLNYAALKQTNVTALSVSLYFNVTNSLGKTKVMYGPSLDVTITE